MKFAKQQLLGVGITVVPKGELLIGITQYLQGKDQDTAHTPFVVVTPNPEQLVEAVHAAAFRAILNHADIALPDGIGVVFGMWASHHIRILRISGIDFLSDLVRLANKEHATIGFVGGRNDTAHNALTGLQNTYVELHGWSEQPKEFASDEEITNFSMDSLVRKIVDTNTKMVFVGLGAPKQELFINALAKRLKTNHVGPILLMAVGGSFDMLAGKVTRAPGWMQTVGLEWLWRLLSEPWRWKRQLRLFSFLFLVFRDRFSHT